MNDNENNYIYENNSDNNTEILNEEFFKAFLPSQKITDKKKKINELITNLKHNKIYLSSLLSINNRKKLSKLYEVILSNLTENNNNFILSQLELIDLLGQYLYDQNEYKSFYRQALPKLFDKFYLQNQKINDNIIQMFNSSISNGILSIEDYYPQIENIALEEDDDYKVVVLNFFYNQILNNDTILYDKIPKNIVDIISKNMQNQNSDISEVCSKIMNAFENNIKNNNIIKNNDNNLNNNNLDKNNFNINSDNENNDFNINSDNDDNFGKINDIKDKSSSSIEDHNVNFDDFIQNEDMMQENNNNYNNKISNKKYIYDEENINNIDNKRNNYNQKDLKDNNYNSEEEENNNIKNYKRVNDNYNNSNSEDEKDNQNNKYNNFNSEDENNDFNNNKNNKNNFNSDDDEENNNNIRKNKNFEQSNDDYNNEEGNNNNNNSYNNINNISNNKSNNNSNNNSYLDIDNGNKNNNYKNISNNKDSENENSNIHEEREEQINRFNKLNNIISDNEEDINKNENERDNKSKKKFESNKKEKNYRSRINRSRKLGVIKKNKLEKDNNFNDNKENEEKVIKNSERKRNENSFDNNEKEETDHGVENKKVINIDDMPIKGVNNNDNINKNQEIDYKPRKNFDNKQNKAMPNDDYNNEDNENFFQKNEKEPETKNKITNFDDLPIKGANNYNYDNNIDREKNIKKNNNIINIDELPIKGVVNYNNNEAILLDNENNNQNENINDNMTKKKSVLLEFDFSDETKPNKKSKKNINNQRTINKNSKKVKKDPFENLEVQVPHSYKNEEVKIDAANNDNNFNNNYNDEYMTKEEQVQIMPKDNEDLEKKIEREMEKEKEREKEREKEKEMNKDKEKEKEIKEDIKFESIKLILGEEIVELISSNKWEEKKQGYELILNLINKDIIESNYINDLYEYIKFKLKGFKETNFNINREALNIFLAVSKKGIMPKKLLNSLIMAYSEKISDIKLKDNIIELINENIQKNGTEIIQELIKKLLKKNNPKLLIEYSNLFGKIITDNKNISNNMPNKELVDYSKFMANNSNSQVRTASINLICILYKTYGMTIKAAIKDIKESTLKIIEAELDKIELSPELKENIDNNLLNKTGQSFKVNDENEKEKENKEGGIPNTPQDISKKVTKEILKDIDEGKWQEKKEAVEKLEKIINDSNMKILPNGLNDLFNLIKMKLSDCNKNLVKILISLLSKLIESLKIGFKIYAKNIALSLIPNLADKSLVIRNECLNCFDKWVENTGLETLVIYFPQFLKTENIESRIEIMKFIQKYHNNFNKNKNLGENVYKELIDPLLICLQDRTNNVRTKAEEVIQLSFDYIPVDIYYKKIKDFKPAIAEDLKQIVNKIEVYYKNNLKEINDEEDKIGENNNSIIKKNNVNNNQKNNIKKKNSNINNQDENIKKKDEKNNSVEKSINHKKNPKNKKENINSLKDSMNIQTKKSTNKNSKKNDNNKKKKNQILFNDNNDEGNDNIDNNDDEENMEENNEEIEEENNEENSFISQGNTDLDKEIDENENNFDEDEYEEINKPKNKINIKNNINKKLNNKVNNNNKKQMSKKIYNKIIKEPKNNESQNNEFNNMQVKSKNSESIKKQKQNKNINANLNNQKTRNNRYKENKNDENNLNLIENYNKSISLPKFNSEARRILSKSSAKKKLPDGKSKQVIDLKTKKALLFQDEFNNNNDLNNNNQRILSNSVHLRNNNKTGMRRTKSVEKRNNKKKNVLFKYSKVFLINNRLTLNKNKRYELDKKYKFNLNTLTKDDIKSIKEISEKLFTEEFLKKMLNIDFLKQIEALKEMKENLDKKENIQVYFDNLDIILKLISVKIYNNFNPALSKGLCEFLESLFTVINEHGYNINDIEINIILALLIEKLQINNIEIRTQINHLMKLYISLFDIYKIVMQILNMTLICNNKIKAGVLEFILDLNQNENLNICYKNIIRIFSLFLHCNDNDVKTILLELFRNIYNNIGDKLWNLDDVISPKEKNYLKNNLFKDRQGMNLPKNQNDEEEEGNENAEEYENEEENDDNEDIDNNYGLYYNEDENKEEQNNFENKLSNNNNNKNNKYSQNKNNLNNNVNRTIIVRNSNKKHNYYLNQYEKYDKDNINNNEDNINDENIGEENTYYKNLANNDDSDTFFKLNENSYNTLDNNKLNNIQNPLYSINDTNQNKNNETNNTSKAINILKKNKNNNPSKLNKNLPKTNNPKKTYNNNIRNDFTLEEKNINLPKNKSIEKKQNMLLSPKSTSESIKSEKDLLNILNNLSSEDESEKLNTIIIVHEILCTKYQENKYFLIPCIDNIILIFIKITHYLFDEENIENISVKFAKYLVTILCKLAANKELISNLNYKVLNDLIYELLNYLLISNLDKIGENQEGNIIFKSLNSAMLRILENCDTTSVILVLLEIIKQNQIKEEDYNLSNLAIKCLIKITQNLKEYINRIQFDKILFQMHLILIKYDEYINKMELKTQTDMMTVKFIKNFIIDVVKIKKEGALEDYNKLIKNHKFKDKYIYNWIKNTLLMIKNVEANKQTISDNISKSALNKTYNEDFENENETIDKNQSETINSENKLNNNNIYEINSQNFNNNLKSTPLKTNKVNNKKFNDNENKGNFKEDCASILERIKLLKQNLKDNHHINNNNMNNSLQIKRKKSIETNKKNKNKK